MTETQNKLFSLAKEYEEIKDKMEKIRGELESVMANLGTNTYHQDPETMVVYKVVVPKGHFVSYRTLNYERTSLPDETRGTLSKKEATEKGFYLKK